MDAITPFSICACGLVLYLTISWMAYVWIESLAWPSCSRCGAGLDWKDAPANAICTACALDNALQVPVMAKDNQPSREPRVIRVCDQCGRHELVSGSWWHSARILNERVNYITSTCPACAVAPRQQPVPSVR